MDYNEYIKTEDFKIKCNTIQDDTNQFYNDWIPLNRHPEIGLFLSPKGTIVIYDGYYSQTFEILPNELLGLIEEIGTQIPIGFDGSLWYNFDEWEIHLIKKTVRFMEAIKENYNER